MAIVSLSTPRGPMTDPKTGTAVIEWIKWFAARVVSAVLQGDPAGCVILYGTGTPEAVVVAPVGSLFLRTDGGASTTLYVKEVGATSAGWVGK